MTNQPLLLDLFCGAGGAAVGYSRAGFRVVGVDNQPQKHYPFQFIQTDALDFLAEYGKKFDYIHASPPCQLFSRARYCVADQTTYQARHHDLLEPLRELLLKLHKPYVIENVVGAPLLNPALLCGSFFGLKVYRHRLFESNKLILCPPHIPHHDNTPSRGRGISEKGFVCVAGGGGFGIRDGLNYARHAMGELTWMNTRELSQAIPPAYTEFVGRQLLGQW